MFFEQIIVSIANKLRKCQKHRITESFTDGAENGC